MVARFVFMFPGGGFNQSTIDRFNRLAREELEEIRDLLVLHYTATEREDTPFWRHCRAIDKPDSLKQAWEMYEQSGDIIIEGGVLFREPSWFAIFHGQGLKPRAYHPFANIPSDAELQRRFDLMAGDVLKRVATFPTHDEWIRANCPAPPVPMKAM
jgi:tryptophan halogenase